MAETAVVRRFFRREDDELTVHEQLYSPHTSLIAFHILASAIADPVFEVEEVTNFEDGFSDEPRISVRWQSCRIGYEEERQYITAGFVLGRHRGLGGLRVVAAIVPTRTGVLLRVIIRSEDSKHLSELLDWVKRLEETDHPLKGRLFGLGRSRLDFLPTQAVGRETIVLPSEILDEIERNFDFLDEPEAFPSGLRHRAILLAGAPGVGKTMVAKWLADRFACTGLWVTPGALWELGPAAIFDLAVSLRPTLLILEDLDVAAGERKGHQPLGELLGQMDGFTDLTDIAIIATTNCPENLDFALDPEKRPGRFHRMFTLDAPDRDGRSRLLQSAFDRSEVIDAIPPESLRSLVDNTDNRSGAQLTELVRDIESRLLWHRRRNEDCPLAHIVESIAEDRFNSYTRSFGFSN